MNWKQPINFSGSTLSLETLLDDSLHAFNLPSGQTGERPRASDYLAGIKVEKLVELDERLRSHYVAAFRHWPDNALLKITSAEIDSPLRQALLFLAASHTDGRVRQKTLWILPQFPSRLTLAVALIRCADWVPEVGFAAQDAVTRLLELCADEDVFEVWPLVIRLHARIRLSREWLHDHVESWMFRSEKSPWLLKLLRSKDGKVRSWAFAQSLADDVSLSINILDTAFDDPDPVIALHALRHAQSHCETDRIQALAKKGLGSAHSVIRRESLRILAASAVLPAHELLCRALCDRSAGVRGLAAFLLRESYSEDATTYWRDALDRDDDRPTLGALISLANVAEEQDLARFRKWLSHPGSLVRMYCVRGILKANGEISNQELTELLASGGLRVRNLLADSIRRGSIPFGLDRTLSVMESVQVVPAAQQNFRELFAALGHWDRLSLILRLRLAVLDAASPLGMDLLTDWINASDAYAPLVRSRKVELLNLVEACRAAMDATSFNMIQNAVGRH
jgi:hypothetical protein